MNRKGKEKGKEKEKKKEKEIFVFIKYAIMNSNIQPTLLVRIGLTVFFLNWKHS